MTGYVFDKPAISLSLPLPPMRHVLLVFTGLLLGSGFLLGQVPALPAVPAEAPGGSSTPALNPVTPPPPDLPVTPSEAIPVVPDEAKPALKELMTFLAAPNWEARLSSIAMETSLRPAVAAYYATHQDGPLPFKAIEQFTSEKKAKGEPSEFAFLVYFHGLDHAVPTKLVLTKSGYKVDWLLFTEFKDNQLLDFAKSYHETTGRFHVLIHRSHYFQKDVPQLESKQCFEIHPPMPGYVVNAFVEKDSHLADLLQKPLSWDVPNAFAVVELKWKKKGSYEWLELAGVPQFDWHDTFKVGGAGTGKKKS